MITLVTTLLALVSILFGIYQWRRQRGRVRVQVDEGQGELYLRVRVDAPASIQVDAMWLQITGRGRLRRLLRWLKDPELAVPKRFVALWRFRDVDLLIARMEQVGEWHGGLASPQAEREALYPIAGPPLPATVSGYHDATWVLPGVNFVPTLVDALGEWASKKPKLQFRVAISGHPQRMVRSRTISLGAMALLKPENAHWMDGDGGLPQPPFARESRRDLFERLQEVSAGQKEEE